MWNFWLSSNFDLALLTVERSHAMNNCQSGCISSLPIGWLRAHNYLSTELQRSHQLYLTISSSTRTKQVFRTVDSDSLSVLDRTAQPRMRYTCWVFESLCAAVVVASVCHRGWRLQSDDDQIPSSWHSGKSVVKNCIGRIFLCLSTTRSLLFRRNHFLRSAAQISGIRADW